MAFSGLTLLSTGFALADSPLHSIINGVFGGFDPTQPGGLAVLDTILRGAQKVANQVFVGASILEFVSMFFQLALNGAKMNELWYASGRTALRLTVVSGLINGLTWWYPELYKFFASLGVQLSGAMAAQACGAVSCTAPGSVSAPTVAGVMDAGFDLVWALLAGKNSNPLDFIAHMTAAITSWTAPICLMILGVYCVLAAQLAFAQMRFLIFSYGTALLGFAVNRVTQPIAQGTIHLGITCGVQLMAMLGYCGIMAIWGQWVISQFDAINTNWWDGVVNLIPGVNAINMAVNLPTYLMAGAGTFFLGFIGIQIPKISEAWLTGSPTITLGDFVKSATSAAMAALAPVAVTAAVAAPFAAPALAGAAAAGAAGSAASAGGIASGMNAIGGAGLGSAAAAGASAAPAAASAGSGLSTISRVAQVAQAVHGAAHHSRSTIDDLSHHFGAGGGSAQLRA